MRKRAIRYRGESSGAKKRRSTENISVIETETKEQAKPLFLIMQKHWFDEILSGRKNVEYRDGTPFYRSRLLTKDGKFKRYSSVIMQVGYHSDARRMTFEIEKIELDDCFNIYLGKITDKNF